MTETDFMLASYIQSLEERVERLKTLEEAVPAGAGYWTFITSQELSVASASIDFSSLDQSFNDLLFIWRARSDYNVAPNRSYLAAQFNGDTTAGNYDSMRNSQSGNGTCYKDCGYALIGHITNAQSTGNSDSFGCGLSFLPLYTSTVWSKNVYSHIGCYGPTAAFGLCANMTGSWNQTSAITSIKFYDQRGGNLLADSRIDIYGLNR